MKHSGQRNLRYKKSGLTPHQQEFHLARRRMVELHLSPIVQDVRVLGAMACIPRHLFVEEGLRDQAYSDRPLPIGSGQTISQPQIVALMSSAARLSQDDRVLEIGTGCGYQTAVLCELVSRVYSIERLAKLSHRARRVLYDLGYVNFKLRIGDGTLGWPEEASFDAILVTAGAPVVPEALIRQLTEDGRLIIPIGSGEKQELQCITRRGDRIDIQRLTPCRFVPLIGEQGWEG